MDLSKLSREDLMVGAGGLVLLIGLLAFPWFSVSLGPLGSYEPAATSSSGGIWAVLALIVLIAVIVDLALARFSPSTVLPTSPLGRELTRAAAVGVVALLMALKLVAHVGDFGWGFYIDIVLLVVVASGAWLNSQGRSTPVGVSDGV